MLTIKRSYGLAAILLSLLLGTAAQASVTLTGTRIIFPSGEKEATIQLTNEGSKPALVQAWLDKGNNQESPENIDVPFVITPTIMRIEAGKTQTLRIIYSGEALPADKESLFWLNVLDVPPKAKMEGDSNNLQFAFRTRVKLMYRPGNLPGNAQEAPAQLQWSAGVDAKNQPVLNARNPSAFVVNVAGVEVQLNGKSFEAGVGPVLPGQVATFPIKEPAGANMAGATGATVMFSSINDWGASLNHEARIGNSAQ
ncbi:putative fimbrial chaperone YadV|uniref:fimbrial biogenesis chaperone n=1 Tax=Delftia acidovorans TaxID=80866 RepID=UPI001C0B2F84|nr:fimbria/pilus periplasmic chaperone [Delftia acidovorans]MCA1070023.1 putative fimbrial chaperone YadV [Delftia acidovorans]